LKILYISILKFGDRNVYRLIAYLQREGVAHNLFLTRGKSFDDDDSNNNLETLRVFVWPRKSLFDIMSITSIILIQLFQIHFVLSCD